MDIHVIIYKFPTTDNVAVSFFVLRVWSRDCYNLIYYIKLCKNTIKQLQTKFIKTNPRDYVHFKMVGDTDRAVLELNHLITSYYQ